PGVSYVDLVAGAPRGGDPSSNGTVDQLGCQCGLYGKSSSVRGYSRAVTAVRIFSPAAGKVESAVDESVPAGRGVGQVDRHLGVLDPAGGAGVLALHPDRRGAFLHGAGFVDPQDRAGIAERVDDVVTQIIADLLGVPAGAGQQVLQP